MNLTGSAVEIFLRAGLVPLANCPYSLRPDEPFDPWFARVPPVHVTAPG
jgi:hypothetical protein